MQKITRLTALATAAVAAPTIISSTALSAPGRTAPSDRIVMATIGTGGRGTSDMRAFLGFEQVQMVATCDPVTAHRLRAKDFVDQKYGNKDCKDYNDFQEVLDREDIDAVLIGTPDHWHALCALEAIRNGKDIYGEKPVSHTFAEGKVIREQLEKSDTVFQTGSQQRSDPLFRRAVELVINGHIGKVNRIEVGLPPGYADPQGDDTVEKPPTGLDYEKWCGPAEKLPYMRARHHRWWRGHRAFGGGVLMDWIGHHNDIAHWSMGADQTGPLSVEAIGWQYPETKVYNTPRDYEIACEYADGIKTSISNRHKLGTKWLGEDGWIYADRGKLTASDERLVGEEFDRGEKRMFESPGHLQNFLDCVRSRSKCVAPAETAHRSITPGFLGYVSNQLGRKLVWDASAEQVVNDEEANRLLNDNPYRAPWSLQ